MSGFVRRAGYRVFFLAAFLAVHPIGADAVEVKPARLELRISPEEPSSGTFKLTNHSPKAVEVRIQTGPYRFLQTPVPLPSAESWFIFEPSKLTLASGVTTTVAYQITPPPNVSIDTAGEYLAAILVDELPVQPEKANITIVPRFAMPVYLQILGREKTAVEIQTISLTATTADQLRLETVLHNLGTVHIRPAGTLAILESASGRVVQSGPLGRTLPLMPRSTQKILSTLAMLPAGSYTAVVTIELSPGQLQQKEIHFEITKDHQIR